MDQNEVRRRILAARDFAKPYAGSEDFLTDQKQKLAQPPLYKGAMREESCQLPTCFETLPIDRDFLHVLNSRESRRVYTQEKMTLLELSYLLWCMQGVKKVRGKSYATLRTVPSGGARHPFEVYMTIQNVEGLPDGYYHYLPQHHSIELLRPDDDMAAFITTSLMGQKWAVKANVVFYFSFVCYRAEWRYSFFAHRVVLIDAGHVTQNLYLAATSIGRGGCAIGSVDMDCADQAFELDGEEEFIFYAMPVGTVSQNDRDEEDSFYSFVREEGL